MHHKCLLWAITVKRGIAQFRRYYLKFYLLNAIIIAVPCPGTELM